MIRIVDNYSFTLDEKGNVRLPKHALYMRQQATATAPARYVYVLDMRECVRESFRVYTYTPKTGKRGYYRSFPGRDSVGRMFAQYVLREYGLSPYSAIPAPIWPIYHRDNIGQPRDRLPQRFDAKRAYVKGTYSTEERYVTDGALIGTYRHTDESYSSVRLGLDSIQY